MYSLGLVLKNNLIDIKVNEGSVVIMNNLLRECKKNSHKTEQSSLGQPILVLQKFSLLPYNFFR